MISQQCNLATYFDQIMSSLFVSFSVFPSLCVCLSLFVCMFLYMSLSLLASIISSRPLVLCIRMMSNHCFPGSHTDPRVSYHSVSCKPHSTNPIRIDNLLRRKKLELKL